MEKILFQQYNKGWKESKLNRYPEEKIGRVTLTTRFTKPQKKRRRRGFKYKAAALSIRPILESLLHKVETRKEEVTERSYLTYTRWLITDSVLQELDEEIFKNMLVTRLEHPTNPNWLIMFGLRQLDIIAFDASYIFVACGLDWCIAQSPDPSVGINFLRELHCWIKECLNERQISRIKTVYKDGKIEKLDSQYLFQQPIIVAITAPEVGEHLALKKAFNKDLRKFIHEYNESQNSYQDKNFCSIELLDWANLLKPKIEIKEEPSAAIEEQVLPTQKDIEIETENRVKTLVVEMCDSYGVVLR